MDDAARLTELGFGTYADTFIENGVDAGLLPHLTNEGLKDPGVSRLASALPAWWRACVEIGLVRTLPSRPRSGWNAALN